MGEQANTSDSILLSTKKLLGIEPELTAFDDAIVIHINTALSILSQLGVGTECGMSVTDERAAWSEIIGESASLSLVKTYVQMKVKLMFDPPASSAAMDSINKLLSELEWRILAVTDYRSGGSGTAAECVDELARTSIEKHAADKSIHCTADDVEEAIHNIGTIRATL